MIFPFILILISYVVWLASLFAQVKQILPLMGYIEVGVMGCCVWSFFSFLRKEGRQNKWMVLFLVLLFLSNFVGVMLPEVGFDALWYHLPIARVFGEMGRATYTKEIYQSALPHLGSILYAPMLMIAGVMGVKLLVFALSLSIPMLTFRLAKRFLDKHLALLLALGVYAFHVVAWQSSSAYVDQIRTVLELGAFILLFEKEGRKWWEIAGLGVILGLAWSIKMVAFLFVPAWLGVLAMRWGWKKAGVVLGVAGSIFAPWMVWGYAVTGKLPLLFAGQVTNDLIVTGNGIWFWIWQSVIRWLSFPSWLAFWKEGYTTPLFFLLTPFLMVLGWEKRLGKEIWGMMPFIWIWILIAPLSVRYGLAYLIVFLILGVKKVMEEFPSKRMKKIMIAVLVLGVLGSLAIRIGVNLRGVPYLMGKETQSEYLSRFRKGISVGPFERWYGK